jgi:hypothetical protein
MRKQKLVQGKNAQTNISSNIEWVEQGGN